MKNTDSIQKKIKKKLQNFEKLRKKMYLVFFGLVVFSIHMWPHCTKENKMII